MESASSSNPCDSPGDREEGTAGEGWPVDPEAVLKCEETIESMELEEVAHSEYYRKHKSVPDYHTRVYLRRSRQGARFEVATEESGEAVGLVPEKKEFSHLGPCMGPRLKFRYVGTVESYSNQPPKVTVRLQPDH